jgi:ketosteroid isomerase-like protein
MSRENVEIVRQVYADWERGDFREPDCFDPGISVVWADPMFARQAESGGLQELSRSMAEFLDAWDDATATAEQLLDAGDKVVVSCVWRARGKTSGVTVESPQGSVWTLRDGKVIRMENYPDPSAALEAAGLRTPSM